MIWHRSTFQLWIVFLRHRNRWVLCSFFYYFFRHTKVHIDPNTIVIQRIPIDVCKLGGTTSFLQQACDSTNGIFMKIRHAHGLVQYLLSAYSVEPTLRPHINLSTQRDVDFRAACFITKNVVDIGFVCSVCLCIMSVILPTGDCPMCGTKFGQDVIDRMLRKPYVLEPKKKKKKQKLDSATPTPASPALNSVG